MKQPQVNVSGAPHAFCAAWVVKRVTEVIAARGHCRLAISGGKTPGPMFELLGTLMPAHLYGKLAITWIDERWLPLDHQDSNYDLAQRRWLATAPAVETMPLYRGRGLHEDAEVLGERFDMRFGGLDVAVLGVGPDGHVASLFPGHPKLDDIGPVIAIEDAPKPPPERLTLSRAVIEGATHLALLVTGADRADAVGRAFAGDADLPLGRLAPQGEWVWFCDRAAAADIPPGAADDADDADETEGAGMAPKRALSATAEIGVIGLGVMGASLARNFRSRGRRVAVYNRNPEVTDAFFAAHDDGGYVRCDDYAALRAAFGSGPARIVSMVTAGAATDAVIDAIEPHLRAGDVFVDGGNAHFQDTERRLERARKAGWRFVGMGVSGGERGALEGPSMMPGGDPDAWPIVEPLMVEAAAVADTGPCVTWCGRGGAGHFVKMVHNGIEYGDMQLIAEIHGLMGALAWSPAKMREVFTAWNRGPLKSFLVEITAGIVGAKDAIGGGALVDAILDVAEQKGTGRWTAVAATELGVPIPTITAAVDARAMSARKALRVEAEGAGLGRLGAATLAPIAAETLEAALYAAKLMSYTQGFALLAEASRERGYGIDLKSVARIWKAGCIIRAVFLDRVYDAFARRPDLPLLFLADDFAAELGPRVGALRAVVGGATAAGQPVPALAASLGYFDTMTRARGTAALIQAQRDWFGAHTYRRVDAPGEAVHTEWEGIDQL
ncbi:MAG: NADP-dependent phosphogluconate dehydrogenase [Myxococcales bacterium]|nr:NADP-dependent phosphogluconate dehydrogenase [Myxococcales bacterium]MCB9552456.1 NADP-dependent phosphogluconate dehydrogenase [Myxococcales bacterium]